MAEAKGIVETCDRCGASNFRKYLKTTDYDGGFTKVDNFEPRPEGWGCFDVPDKTVKVGNYVTLCPKCSDEYIKLFSDFMKSGGQ